MDNQNPPIAAQNILFSPLSRENAQSKRERFPKTALGIWKILTSTKPSVWLALLLFFIGAISIIFPFSWLKAWPSALTLPATQWIGSGLTFLFEYIKPAARAFSTLLGFPMRGVNWLLVNTPYIITIGCLTALGWYIDRLKMALLVLGGLSFILMSGYWIASMNTLALVVVSVPLALLSGGLIGLLANEYLLIRRFVGTLLDIMQTVPTFAYLTPLLLLFGFGPVVGLIASIIYAAPPMTRNVILGLQQVDQEIREAAITNGATRRQQLFLVEIPAASRQIMMGVNQTTMAALSMVIIAAVIGGFNDIGWEVLLTMRRAVFGQSLIAGLVIVIFAVLADRMSSALVTSKKRGTWYISLIIFLLSLLITLFQPKILPQPHEFSIFKELASGLDTLLSAFIVTHGGLLDAIKNSAMFFILLPLRIGLNEAVLPFTWGFAWSGYHSLTLYGVVGLLTLYLILKRRVLLGLCLLVGVGVLVSGIANLSWIFVLVTLGGLGWFAGGFRLSLLAVGLFGAIAIMGLWQPALLSLYLILNAVLTCVLLGSLIGFVASLYDGIWCLVRPVCDFLQTIPQFVFLIPVLMFFQIGEFSAFLAICAYAIVPMIRYSYQGLKTTPEDLIEAAVACGTSGWQIMREVRIPYAIPTLLLGLNQTILYAFSMLVIAALVGTTDLGQQIYLALGQGDVGLGLAAGASMAMMAIVGDRLVAGFARKKRQALGL